MTKVLVTGGAGFIGSHTCLMLLEKGYQVVVIDSFVNSSRKSLDRVLEICKLNNNNFQKNLIIYEGDLRNQNLLKKIFEDAIESGELITGVIHFAGLKSVKESVENPFLYYDVNINSSINLFKTMNQFNCRYIVFSSSATIYGDCDSENINENNLIDPINPYGNTKSIIERFLQDIFKISSNEWFIANLRYFNPIGAHDSGLLGEDPKGMPNNIFPIILKVALRKIDKLMIFGNDWPTLDGTGVRDYIHIMDLAEGHIRVMEYLLNNKPQIINLNLGTGKGASVLELIKTFQNENKETNVPFQFTARRDGDVAKVVADNSLLKKTLNWSPSRGIEEMCKDGWKWKILNKNGYE